MGINDVCLIMHIMGYISDLGEQKMKSKEERNLIVEIVEYFNSESSKKFGNRKGRVGGGLGLCISWQKLFELVLGIHGIKIQKKRLVGGELREEEASGG